jgi:predicted lipoprotein with Yx(FWY)xxD motif
MRERLGPLVVLIALPLVLFACGGSTSRGLLNVAYNAKLKQNILVDAKGMTLYLWNQETDGVPTCFDDATYHCSRAWIPLRATKKATVGRGGNKSLLGTVPRKDGDPQVTYDRHPLYTDAGSAAAGLKGDRKPGDVNGQGFYDWYAVTPAGRPITKLAP